MARKLKAGFVEGRFLSVTGVAGDDGDVGQIPIIYTEAKPARCWFAHEAPEECWEPEETLAEKGDRRIAEIRKLTEGGEKVYVQVVDSPVTPDSGRPADFEWAGKCGMVVRAGDGRVCRVVFAPGDAWMLIWANNLTILNHIPSEFAEEAAEEASDVKAAARVAEIQARIDEGETVHVRFDTAPRYRNSAPTSPVPQWAGRVARVVQRYSEGGDSVRLLLDTERGAMWFWAGYFTVLTPEEVLRGLNRDKA